jgi:hypothetical protein
MQRMGIEALYRRPRTTKPEPGHKTQSPWRIRQRRLLRNRRHRRSRSLPPRAKEQWHGARHRCNGTDQLGYRRAPGAAPTVPELEGILESGSLLQQRQELAID